MKENHPVETPNQNEYHGNRFTETIVESNFNVKLPSKPFSIKALKKSRKKIFSKHFNENSILDEEQLEIVREKKRQTIQRIEHLKTLLDPKNAYPKYPYLQTPFRCEDPIVDRDQFNKKFRLPDKICPLIYKIDPRSTSLDQLELEKRIMKEKIRELMEKKKSTVIGSNVNQSKVKKTQTARKKTKTKGEKKEKKVETTTSKSEMISFESLGLVKSESLIDKLQEQEEQESERPTFSETEIFGESTVENESRASTGLEKKTDNLRESNLKKDKKKDMSKKKMFDEERLKLYAENLSKQIEKENVYNLIKQNLKEKKEEILHITEELENNMKELKLRNKEIESQIREIDENIAKEVKYLNITKAKFLIKLDERFIEERKNLKNEFDLEKVAKREHFTKRKNEVDYVLSIYPQTSKKSISDKKFEIEEEFNEWFKSFEIEILDSEQKLYDKVNDEEDKFLQFLDEEEARLILPLKESKERLLNEQKETTGSFEDIKQKIKERIDTLQNDIARLEIEKEAIELSNEENIQIQTAKLNELLQIEREAKEKIKEELDNYHREIMKIREKNLELRYDLTILKHMHGITRAYVFSYFSELTIYGKTEVN